jgi:nicotinate (nicotinamide) nucleotide adenylyltransferase
VAQEESDLRARIESINADMTMREIAEITDVTFQTHFGKTTDEERLRDIEREFYEFMRALSYDDRIMESGDLFTSLLKFSKEQKTDPADAIRRTLLKVIGRADLYAVHGNKINVAVLGGSFDMPTGGHVALGKAVLDAPEADIDQAWIMPSYQNHGPKRLTDPVHRAAMCRLFEQIDPRFRFFGYEMDKQLKGETLQTLLRLMNEPFADQYRFHFVITVETARSMKSWPRIEELKRAAIFITTPRPGYALRDDEDQWFRQKPHIYLANAKGLIEVASSDVRPLYAAGRFEEAAKLVHPLIHAYIMEHKLYRPQAA